MRVEGRQKAKDEHEVPEQLRDLRCVDTLPAWNARTPRYHRTRTVISKDQVMPLLMEACPSYRLPAEDRELLYVMLADFAHHLLQLHRRH